MAVALEIREDLLVYEAIIQESKSDGQDRESYKPTLGNDAPGWILDTCCEDPEDV